VWIDGQGQQWAGRGAGGGEEGVGTPSVLVNWPRLLVAPRVRKLDLELIT